PGFSRFFCARGGAEGFGRQVLVPFVSSPSAGSRDRSAPCALRGGRRVGIGYTRRRGGYSRLRRSRSPFRTRRRTPQVLAASPPRTSSPRLRVKNPGHVRYGRRGTFRHTRPTAWPPFGRKSRHLGAALACLD